MQLKNLSVAKKIWGLLLGVMVLTLVAGFSMTTYISRLEAVERVEVQTYDYRIRQAVQWRGVTDFAVSHVVMGAMSNEESLNTYAQGKTQEGIAAASALQQALERDLTSPQGRQQLEKIAQARAKVLEVTAALSKLRAAGDLAQARSLLDAQLLPAVSVYNQAQTDLVSLQERMRDQS